MSEEYKRHRGYKSLPARQYGYLLMKAKKKGNIVTLTQEEFTVLRAQPCHCCAHKLPDTGYCIDRKDPSVGYTPENSVPCCTVCNFTKTSVWSYEEYLVLSKVVAQLLDGRLAGHVTQFPHTKRVRKKQV